MFKENNHVGCSRSQIPCRFVKMGKREKHYTVGNSCYKLRRHWALLCYFYWHQIKNAFTDVSNFPVNVWLITAILLYFEVFTVGVISFLEFCLMQAKTCSDIPVFGDTRILRNTFNQFLFPFPFHFIYFISTKI